MHFFAAILPFLSLVACVAGTHSKPTKTTSYQSTATATTSAKSYYATIHKRNRKVTAATTTISATTQFAYYAATAVPAAATRLNKRQDDGEDSIATTDIATATEAVAGCEYYADVTPTPTPMK